jgi:hypothetical protein
LPETDPAHVADLVDFVHSQGLPRARR